MNTNEYTLCYHGYLFVQRLLNQSMFKMKLQRVSVKLIL